MAEPTAATAFGTEPPDADQRRRIASDLGATLFVEAGAGSGKTTALVTRIVGLVASGAVELSQIAAITFTEKAAAELRDRIRAALAARELEARRGGLAAADRFRSALDQLDGAAIGTLHAFAHRLLREHPVEAGIPPQVEVLDEVTSGLELARRWRAFRDHLLADPALERTLLLLFASGVRPEALAALAAAFADNWDLVDERVPDHAPEPPPVQALAAGPLADIESLCAERGGCRDPHDKLAARLAAIADHAAHLRSLTDEVDLLEALAAPGSPSFAVGNLGRKGSWDGDLKDLQARVRAAGDGLAEVSAQVAQACARRVAVAIRAFTLEAAEERRQAGRLEFHDLLVLARLLLRDPTHGPLVRLRLHRTYRRLLLDEFQDTDPIQIELAVRIASAEPGGEVAGQARWSEVEVDDGHLFVVGDPKQSIYRFRRADIATFLEARDRFGPAAGGPVALTTNFRTGPAIVGWVNETFAALLSEPAGVAVPVPSQPSYSPLDAVRAAPPLGPPVSVIGRAAHPPRHRADDVRAAEATDVAAAISRILDEGWSVEAGGGWRPARLGDIAVLVPARTSLPFLEDALERAGIAFRAESSSLVYATRAVRDLLMVLRAVGDPSDHHRVVSALRTPLLGCGDDDLFRFKVERGGHWSYLTPQPPGMPADDPVASALAYLRGLHERQAWTSPSALLDTIARDRRAFELGFAEGRPRDVWRRLRFVIDQARAWSDATGGGLRQYLQWLDQQTAETARVAEAVLPETDDDAVRVLTVHAAKGLEFPITILSGLSTRPQARPAPAEVVFPPTGGVGYRFGAKVATVEYSDWKPIDEQMAHDERIRLLYVAATRARDHLVLSLHRTERSGKAPVEPRLRTNAETLLAGMGSAVDQLPDAVLGAGAGAAAAHRAPAPPPTPEAPPPFAVWQQERAAALAAAARPAAVAATALTADRTTGAADQAAGPADPGLAKRPRDLDLPPWLKGRYGTAVGRAVHGVLQTVDLATGEGVDAAVAAQCQAEAIVERSDDVRFLVGAALAAPAVRAAASAEHWREVYACVPVGDRLLEGYVDLLYREGAGLVVVDHKTASSSDAAELDRRVAGYRLQGGAYAAAVAAAAGEPVHRVVFVFLTPEGAVERVLPDLDAAVSEVRALVEAGAAVTVD